jgi:hypothetical protein
VEKASGSEGDDGGTGNGERGTDLDPDAHTAQFLALCRPYEEDEIEKSWSQQVGLYRVRSS